MADETHLKILMQGVEAWNRWREENPGVRPDLSGADLGGARLSGADLKGVNLMGANLREASLDGANLSEANLSWAMLVLVNLSGASLDGANLDHAVLVNANLRGVNLGAVDISVAIVGPNFDQANLSKTRFDNEPGYLEYKPEEDLVSQALLLSRLDDEVGRACAAVSHSVKTQHIGMISPSKHSMLWGWDFAKLGLTDINPTRTRSNRK